ncbi:MAG TPA: hypothetical protein ENL21_06030 [Caldithrix abyssi]|uniref:PNPLA domain-containing protein n=1 Tax=Caldithrix abyssi TaxID=187145 RepID=A0A7V5H488_CALAY|nr:hypothetical protein [Caldithrix abyssi]
MKNLKIGLVLGGGGARGLAHIGVIKGLLKHNIPLHCVTGASMGAIVGAAFCLLMDIEKVEQNFKHFIFSDKFVKLKGESVDLNSTEQPEGFFHYLTNIVKRRIVINLAINRRGLVDSDRLATAIQSLIPKVKIEHTHLPFACSALNLVTGQEQIFIRGDLHSALLASSSVPGYLPPAKMDGHEFVDGAVIDSFPIEVCKELGADFTIVCDVSPELETQSKFDNLIQVFIRSYRAVVKRLNNENLKKADFLIRPQLADRSWTDFEAIEFFIQQGEIAVEQNIDLLKEKIKGKSGWSYLIKKKFSPEKTRV